MMTITNQLLITYAQFSLFFVLIASLGGMVVYILRKYSKKRWNLTLLEYCFISFAVGIMIYLCLGYILISFKIFNFYTAYLPLLIILALLLFYFLRNKTFHETWSYLIRALKSNQKELLIHGFIIFFIFLVQFLIYWSSIFENSALLAGDPYYWTRQVMYLNENGMVNYQEQGWTYPWGFIMFCSGSVMISPDFTTTYYFMKLACFPYLNLYVLILYTISRRIFKENFLIFFCLLAVLSNMYFLYRIFSFLSSSLAVLLILISLIILLTEIPNYFVGFILPAIFLINPVYSFFILLALIVFSSHEILNFRSKRSLIYREVGSIALLSLFFLSVYGISVIMFYGKNIVEIFAYFIQYSTIDAITISFTPIIIEETNVFNLILGGVYYFIFLVLPIMGIFIRNRDVKDQKRRDFYRFLKICVLLTFGIFCILPIFIKIGFFDTYYPRILEAFFPCVVLLSGISLYRLKLYLENYWQKLKISKLKFNKWINADNQFSRVLNVPNLIIFTIILASCLNLIYVRENLEFEYRYDDSLIAIVFYIENTSEVSSNIGVGWNYINYTFQETHSPFGLLFNQHLFPYSDDYNLTITEFTTFWQINNVEYFIIKLANYNEALRLHIENETLFERIAGGNSIQQFQLYEII